MLSEDDRLNLGCVSLRKLYQHGDVIAAFFLDGNLHLAFLHWTNFVKMKMMMRLVEILDGPYSIVETCYSCFCDLAEIHKLDSCPSLFLALRGPGLDQ